VRPSSAKAITSFEQDFEAWVAHLSLPVTHSTRATNLWSTSLSPSATRFEVLPTSNSGCERLAYYDARIGPMGIGL